ncbi:casein kinase I-like [Penaeus chinensis]|uniref:casein kinase I-like n=1 Tax=Penaeus chinensis TaxID=139456 RepID=UPI001FB7C6E1|nr:casein kinase I-like [Penaeus chinensis]
MEEWLTVWLGVSEACVRDCSMPTLYDLREPESSYKYLPLLPVYKATAAARIVIFEPNFIRATSLASSSAEGSQAKRKPKGKEIRLGKGTYGRVVRVSYKGKECALKLAAPGSKVVFEHEMEMLRRLQGAGGAPLPLAYSEDPSCLLMTYLGKECLADVLSAQRSLKQLLQVSVKLAEAVAAVHAAGIVHCDLKPTNVMVQLRGAAGAPSVHIIDFGLALPLGQCHPESNKGR